MTIEERKEIFLSETITLTELAKLYSIKKSSASALMRRIKSEVGDKLGINGRLLTEDYLRWVNPTNSGRYFFATTEEKMKGKSHSDAEEE